MRINFEYAAPALEPLLMGVVAFKRSFRRKPTRSSPAILIVNTCLVGEFAASIPALHDFMRQHAGIPVDLIVSPPLKELATHLRNIRRVYVALPIAPRAIDRAYSEAKQQIFDTYEEIILLRMSRSAYRLLNTIGARKVHTGAKEILQYGFHIWWNLLRRRTPRPWRTVIATILGVGPSKSAVDEIFFLSHSEQESMATLPPFQGNAKKIVIHTGASWILNRWPTDNWVELLQALHAKEKFIFIFVGQSKIDQDAYSAISTQLDFPVESLIGKISLFELLLVLRQCDFFIGIDSGPRNLAELAGLPSVVLLGPGPHLYTPASSRTVILDRSAGRGFYQRYFHTKRKTFIEHIVPAEVATAFTTLQSSAASRLLA